MISSERTAYLAGLIEGEGWIGVPPRIEVAMTDEDVVRWLRDTYGGKFYVISRSNGYKTVYKWRATGALAVELLAEVLPYLGERRGARAAAALEHNNMRGK